jgi:glycine betaine/proline transport system ATP-binding protein
MKDGRFIQIGSAEQIVLTPADSYVAEFVRGVSRLKIVHARSLMRVLEPGEETHLDSTARVVDVDADLDQMIRVAGEAPGPLLVTDVSKDPLG